MMIDIKCDRQSTLNLLLKFQKTQIDEKYNPFVLLLIYSKQNICVSESGVPRLLTLIWLRIEFTLKYSIRIPPVFLGPTESLRVD